MSEVITGAFAAAGIAACAAIAGVAVGTVKLAGMALTWLSIQAQNEMIKLEKQLAKPMSEFTTTSEARKEFQDNLKRLKGEIKNFPTLSQYGDAAINILALRQSTLGLFVPETQWQNLCRSSLPKNSYLKILNQAATRFTKANSKYVSQSIIEVAADNGFDEQRNNPDEDKQLLVLGDKNGRALVAQIIASEDGAKINLDLTGFGDGSCHQVMDRIMSGLEKKNIHLAQIKRRSHYRREGILAPILNGGNSKKSVNQESRNKENKKTDSRRKRSHHNSHKIKLRATQ